MQRKKKPENQKQLFSDPPPTPAFSLVDPLVEGQDRHDIGHDHQGSDDEQAVADGGLRVDERAVRGEQRVKGNRGHDDEDLERGDLEAPASVDRGGLVGVGGEGDEEVGRGRGEGGE